MLLGMTCAAAVSITPRNVCDRLIRYVKREGVWYWISDRQVRRIQDVQDVLRDQPYLLFYEKQG